MKSLFGHDEDVSSLQLKNISGCIGSKTPGTVILMVLTLILYLGCWLHWLRLTVVFLQTTGIRTMPWLVWLGLVGAKHWMHPMNSNDMSEMCGVISHRFRASSWFFGHSGTDGTVVLGIWDPCIWPSGNLQWYGYGMIWEYMGVTQDILPTSSNLLLFAADIQWQSAEVFLLDVDWQSGDVDPFAIEPLSHPLAPWQRSGRLATGLLPSGYVKIAIENGHRNSGISH